MPTDWRRVACAAVALAGLVAAPARAQTVDDIVRRYVEARGGAARLRAVESLRMTGTIELPEVKAPYLLELKRPNRMRTEFVVQGHTGVRAYDGQQAWELLPLPGEKPRPMAPDEATEARAQADVDLSPLVDAAAKGWSVELVGRDRLPVGETWKLIVRGQDGQTRTLHLDTKSHLVVRSLDVRVVDGQPVEFVTDISDYRPTAGVLYPHSLELGPRAGRERQRLVIDTVEVNPALDDARFRLGATPGPPPRSESIAVLP
jgi:hypothetical protein